MFFTITNLERETVYEEENEESLDLDQSLT